MKKIILLTIIIATVVFSACSFDDTGNVYNHLNKEDPTSIHTNVEITPEEETTDSGDIRCLGQYSEDDITNKDFEIRARVENNIDLCYEMNPEPLIIECPDVSPIIYYSQKRCLDYFNVSK